MAERDLSDQPLLVGRRSIERGPKIRVIEIIASDLKLDQCVDIRFNSWKCDSGRVVPGQREREVIKFKDLDVF